ncbi:MAG: adenosine kinase [Spirochaetales bacterium]|nr:adenosine kinase [Spirochaetales bacterium]
MNIYGIGNTLIDMLCYITEKDLITQGLHKGTMCLIDKARHKELLEFLKDKEITLSAGGSAPNTMITLRQLGIQTTLGGGVGDDELGRVYHEKLKKIGVIDELTEQVEPTGTSIILLTEDRERTMNTYLGANRCYDDINVNIESAKKADIFYFTGYMWDTEPQKRAIKKVLEICKANNIKVAFDLADPFAVGRYRQTFLELIKEYCDIVFANSEEARYLFDNYEAKECCKSMGKLCDIAIVKNGIKGSFISHNNNIISIPVSGSSNPVDTTGAGDTYAAGFLYGIAKGYDVRSAGNIASYLAGEIISILGAQFPMEKSLEIKAYLENNF